DMDKDHPLYSYIAADNCTGCYRSSTITKITVLDLSSAGAPLVLREIYLEGSYQTARRIENSAHLIAYTRMEVAGLTYWPELPGEYYELPYNSPRRKELWDAAVQKAIAENDAAITALDLADLVPRLYTVAEDGSVIQHDFTDQGCSNFVAAADGMSRGFTSILSLDLMDASFSLDADHIVTNNSTIYSSSDTLVIAEPAQDWWWYWGVDDDFEEATNLHSFDVSAAGHATYSASGRIAGTVLNQFSLSEYNGYIHRPVEPLVA
ncbi:beta-propeller domain-containing protein, partial [Thermodesulfobacteriota bacterium]